MVAGASPIRWVPTAEMLADVLTKVMDLRGQFARLTSGYLHIPKNDFPEKDPDGEMMVEDEMHVQFFWQDYDTLMTATSSEQCV